MAHKRSLLTYPLIQRICQRIQAGAYEHVAAEAEGIPRQKLQDWLLKGQARKARKIYRDLRDEVMRAKAHARFMAESKMRLDALLALADFYEKFHTDILNYHASTIAEFLNNIRWGIYEYLQPEF